MASNTVLGVDFGAPRRARDQRCKIIALEARPTDWRRYRVDATGKHALYFQRLTSRAAQSHLPKLIQRPVYKSITIRNWSTTTKLLAMMSE